MCRCWFVFNKSTEYGVWSTCRARYLKNIRKEKTHSVVAVV